VYNLEGKLSELKVLRMFMSRYVVPFNEYTP